jgi:nucleotide-binding universal stress UspA family protein
MASASSHQSSKERAIRPLQRWISVALISLVALPASSIIAHPLLSAATPGNQVESVQAIAAAGATPEAVTSPASPRATPTPPVAKQPGQAVLHPLGIGLAISFIILMANLFRWMFKVPPQLPYAVVKARQSVSALHRILVPTTEEVASERAVELACRLGAAQKAEIVLAYIVEVPFTLSLDTPVPVEQTKGEEALRTARFIVEQHGLPVRTKIIPHRYVWGGILHLARIEMADAIVMSVGTGRAGMTEGVGRTTQEVLKRAECEVILDRVPG